MTRIDPSPRALLIQDVTELLQQLKNPVRALLEAWVGHDFEEETIIKWALADHLARVYELHDRYHEPYHYPTMRIVQELKRQYDGQWDQYLNFFIKAPTLYDGCHDIVIELRAFDLLIWYFPYAL